MNHKLVNNLCEFKKWAKSVKTEDSYGNEKYSDYQLIDELLKNPPEMYPAMVVYVFEKSFDRCGDTETQLCEYVYLSEFTDGFDPNKHENDIKTLEKKMRPYFQKCEEWRDMLNNNNFSAEEIEKARIDLRKLSDKLNVDEYMRLKYGNNWRTYGR